MPLKLTSPYFVALGGGHVPLPNLPLSLRGQSPRSNRERGRRRSSTYNRVRLRPAPPSGLVWLVILRGITIRAFTVRLH